MHKRFISACWRAEMCQRCGVAHNLLDMLECCMSLHLYLHALCWKLS